MASSMVISAAPMLIEEEESNVDKSVRPSMTLLTVKVPNVLRSKALALVKLIWSLTVSEITSFLVEEVFKVFKRE